MEERESLIVPNFHAKDDLMETKDVPYRRRLEFVQRSVDRVDIAAPLLHLAPRVLLDSRSKEEVVWKYPSHDYAVRQLLMLFVDESRVEPVAALVACHSTTFCAHHLSH